MDSRHTHISAHDEKDSPSPEGSNDQSTSSSVVNHFLSKRLLTWGVELRGASRNNLDTEPGLRKDTRVRATSQGIHPVAAEDRTETQFNKIFFIWLSANTNILSCVSLPLPCVTACAPYGELGLKLLCNRFSAGTLGPVAFGLGLRDSCLVILFFNLLCAIPPAYL
jgi:hypothetical protein